MVQNWELAWASGAKRGRCIGFSLGSVVVGHIQCFVPALILPLINRAMAMQRRVQIMSDTKTRKARLMQSLGGWGEAGVAEGAGVVEDGGHIVWKPLTTLISLTTFFDSRSGYIPRSLLRTIVF
jgi:hypothetical protein